MESTPGGNATEAMTSASSSLSKAAPRVSRQFWQAGEFLPETDEAALQRNEKPGLDHARLHPRFLHSNATSHKWALGALVELLDNSMDEVTAGCSYVNVDKVDHPVDGSGNPMLLVEDNGGGMDTSTIRNCMSFGFSLKHGKKMIGQYGNGFKTSTMRLGADAMVLTKSAAAQTCSVGLLSYTFLTETNSQDVVVPIVDYSLQERTRITRGDESEWMSKLKMICDWGPFGSEAEIWHQLDSMPSQGTRVYIWNLWQTSDNLPELDFNTNEHDVRLRGHEDDHPEASGRKKRLDEGMKRCHSYRHSLRSYVSMLYLQWPPNFQIVVRGKEVQPVPVTAGMKHVAVYDYKPRSLPKDDSTTAQNKGPVVVPVYIGFAVEAPDTSVSGFCVYHRNRLIKPFWKVYTSASSVGRGVIGFLQVDFVEPAHDKQDFENTPPLQKLEKYLKRQVPQYWRTKSHLVGYQDHIPAAKPDALLPLSEEMSTPKTDRTAPRRESDAQQETEDGRAPVETVAADEQDQRRSLSRPAVTSALVERRSTEESAAPRAMSIDDARKKAIQKSPSKCLHEMQQHIAQLQQSVQEFCNTYEIKEEAQLVLGRIFGTTMSKFLDPARELKRTCTAQIKGHRQALLFIAKSKKEGTLTGLVPQFIQAEMKAMGLDLAETLEAHGTVVTEEHRGTEADAAMDVDEDAKSRRTSTESDDVVILPAEDEDKQPPTPDTDDGMPAEKMQIDTKEDLPTSRERDPLTAVEIDIEPSTWIAAPPPSGDTSQRFDRKLGTTHDTNQELAQLGLSVVEKFLKTKPPKLGVVQLAPNSTEVHKRGFVSGSNADPLEVVNLSDDIDAVVDPPPLKRHKTTTEDNNGICLDATAHEQQEKEEFKTS